LSTNKNRFIPQSTAEEPERAFLVGVELDADHWKLSETMAELHRLVDTDGAVVVGQTTQRLSAPVAATYIGSGKAHEIERMCKELNVDVVIFDDELSPTQQSNLEHIFGRDIKVIDRTALILDIFAMHATSKEGRMQVRLAQNEYLYPRLRGMWAHLASAGNRMGGGVGSRFGEGESQLEVDRRLVRKRITSIKKDLKHLQQNRNLQRSSRMRSGMIRIALAGYTNAGKSSLMNRLTDSHVLQYDKLFATVDATTRKLRLPGGREVTLTDTVGFIQKLPTKLIDAFKSTLEEINKADIILHVIDASSPSRAEQIATVNSTIQQIGAEKIDRIEVFNKCDLLTENQKRAIERQMPGSILASAKTGEGIDRLLQRIEAVAASKDTYMRVCIPFNRGDLVSLAHDRCQVLYETYDSEGTILELRIPNDFVVNFTPYKEAKSKRK